MNRCAICDEPVEPGQPFRRHARRDARGRPLPAAHTHKACRGKPRTVPFIAQWSGEIVPEPTVVPQLLGGGIRYAGEQPADRDDRGVLWKRHVDRPGVGRPLYGKVHTGRQRRAMAELLCQVCGGPADQDDRGVLWLLEDDRESSPTWPEDLMTTHPPICLDCIRTARQQCPHMWAGNVAVRVRASEVCAVYGHRYTPSRVGPIIVENGPMPIESLLLPYVVAAQLVRALYACTFVSLTDELAARA
ncbi:hypothetical protein ACP4B2_27935 [Streptomyces rochei]|uniref:hypothetical protein n=1 Tax=Streptomyces rochei TaxID=1928 RepID=UPI003D2E71AB